ncbi:flagellin [Devosia sp. WQ 349K1]|uniref:flagellin N-terminal helical domain-containing protein n=1 Tax=Devosia sp. WQ 349K1 TaxID=2800329 RepID=UPI00265F00A6|nr:flagellin [Devosia sp. WQ 349K1]
MSDITLSKAVRTNLLSLQSTADLMARTQERLATGNKVNSALDNPTNFFTASALNSRASDLNSLMDNMSNGIKTLQAADNGLTAITKTLESMQSTLRQARQDKSFQNHIYEVTADSILTVNGGQFELPTEIKLGVEAVGRKAQLTTIDAQPYQGPIPAATGSQASEATGIGARTKINVGGGLANNSVIKVGGIDVTLTGAGAILTPAEIAQSIDDAINANSSQILGDYTVSVGTGVNADSVIIETVETDQPAATVALVSGHSAAQKATSSFAYGSVPTTVTVEGQSISTGGSFETFVASLEASATAGGYRVVADPLTQNITLEALEYGDPAPVVNGLYDGVPAVAAETRIDLTGASVTASETLTFDGQTLTLATGGSNPADLAQELEALIALNTTLNGTYEASVSGNILTIRNRAAGEIGSAPSVTHTFTTAPTNPAVFEDGEDGIPSDVTTTPVTTGVHIETVEAASDKFSINYDNISVEVSITGVKGGVGTAISAMDIQTWQNSTVERINAELKNADINGLEAVFDADGKFSIVARVPEAKTLSIFGPRGVALFGPDSTVTGTPTVDGYSAKTAVDKFVEEINRNYGSKLRASNDNGKLRVENLSTAELEVQFDPDGAGPVTTRPSTIKGNSVRDNLSLQFNDLKNQLDRLSDDASFNGINLLRGDNLKITFNENGSSFIDVQTSDGRGINASALKIENLIGRDLDTDEGIDALINDIKLALSDIRSQASKFGSNLSIVQNRQDFTKKMINTLETGAANLTLADMNEEAANLLALQTRQSLSSSSLSLASQADQSVLQLLQ